MSKMRLAAAGCRRSPATNAGCSLWPTAAEQGALLFRRSADRRGDRRRHAFTTPHGLRMRGPIVVLWRAGMRIHEALALTEADLDARRGSIVVRRGKRGRYRE